MTEYRNTTRQGNSHTVFTDVSEKPKKIPFYKSWLLKNIIIKFVGFILILIILGYGVKWIIEILNIVN